MHSNRVGLRDAFKNSKAWNKKLQGKFNWRMHESWVCYWFCGRRRKWCYCFQYKLCPSQNFIAYLFLSFLKEMVLCKILASLRHLEYTIHMKSAANSALLIAYKIRQTSGDIEFFFLWTWPLSTYSCFLWIYVNRCKPSKVLYKQMMHLHFRAELCKTLMRNWLDRRSDNLIPSPSYWSFHCSKQIRKSNLCAVCKDGTRPH